MSVRPASKPQLVDLAGDEALLATSVSGGDKVGGGTVAAGADVRITPDQLRDYVLAAMSVTLAIACSDESTALTAGTAKVKFINPYPVPFEIDDVAASLSTAQTGGSVLTVDINDTAAGASILSTKITFDNGEKVAGSHASAGSSTPAVISDTSIPAFGEVTVDIDQVGNGTAKGLKVYLIGRPQL